MKPTHWAWFAIVVACACHGHSPAGSHHEGAAVDAGAAYRSLLATWAKRYRDEWTDDGALDLLVVSRTTAPIFDSHEELGPSALWIGLKEHLPSLQRDTFDDFWSRRHECRTPFVFAEAGDARVEYVGSAGPYRPETAGDDEWSKLRAAHPKSWFLMPSRAGWSADGRQGLVYVTFVSSTVCGVYFVVEKSDDEWDVAGEFCAWTN